VAALAAAAALAGPAAHDARAAELAVAQVVTENCAPESERCASERCGRAASGCDPGGNGGGPREEPPRDREEPPSPPPAGGSGADPGAGTADGSDPPLTQSALAEPRELDPGAASGAGGGDLPFTGLGIGALALTGLALLTAGLLAVRRTRRGGTSA